MRDAICWILAVVIVFGLISAISYIWPFVLAIAFLCLIAKEGWP